MIRKFAWMNWIRSCLADRRSVRKVQSRSRRSPVLEIPLAVENLEARTLLTSTIFWTEGFESAAPSSGTRVASLESADMSSRPYFLRTMDTVTEQELGGYLGKQGAWLWRGEDLDGTETITWDGIDITGKTDLQFTGFFGASSFELTPGSGTGRYENTDSLLIEYAIDAGAFQKLIDYRGNAAAAAAGRLARDTDNDGVGDGPILTETLASSGAFSIPGTGTNLKLRLSFNGLSNNEEFAVDQFTLTSEVAGAPEMDVSGLGNSIVDGDVTPSPADDTDFGSVPLTGSFNDNIFTITNSGAGVLGCAQNCWRS